MTSLLSGVIRCGDTFGEVRCIDLADHSHIPAFDAVLAKKHQCRRPEQFVTVEQGALFVVAGGYVEADQSIAFKSFDDIAVVKHLMLDDFAADAPVGVPVEQQRGAGSFGFGEGAIQLCGDRKSTRLNSSHVSISYAVF